jgi:hypothetical protein
VLEWQFNGLQKSTAAMLLNIVRVEIRSGNNVIIRARNGIGPRAQYHFPGGGVKWRR